MKSFFARNLSNAGRIMRDLGALASLIGATLGCFVSVWLGAGLAVYGGFVWFEACAAGAW